MKLQLAKRNHLFIISNGSLWSYRHQIHSLAFSFLWNHAKSSRLKGALKSLGLKNGKAEGSPASPPSELIHLQFWFANLRRADLGADLGFHRGIVLIQGNTTGKVVSWVKWSCKCTTTQEAIKTRSNLLWITEQCYLLLELINPQKPLKQLQKLDQNLTIQFSPQKAWTVLFQD